MTTCMQSYSASMGTCMDAYPRDCTQMCKLPRRLAAVHCCRLIIYSYQLGQWGACSATCAVLGGPTSSRSRTAVCVSSAGSVDPTGTWCPGPVPETQQWCTQLPTCTINCVETETGECTRNSMCTCSNGRIRGSVTSGCYFCFIPNCVDDETGECTQNSFCTCGESRTRKQSTSVRGQCYSCARGAKSGSPRLRQLCVRALDSALAST
jgi:hypothetical protein